jgi:hypothetical protein
MINYDLPFGVDGSRYEYSQDGKKLWDFDILKASPYPYIVSFGAFRTGISWGYKDAWFNRSWAEAKRILLPRIAYHVFYFGEDNQTQLDNMWGAIGKDWNGDHDRICIDLEVEGQNSKYQCTRTTEKILMKLLADTGRYPVAYSRAEWVNRCLQISDLPKELEWWLAGYSTKAKWPAVYTQEQVAGPILPDGITDWLIHQTAEFMPTIGGGGSKYMDYNRFKSYEALDKFFDYQGEGPKPVLTVEERLTSLEQWREKVEATL